MVWEQEFQELDIDLEGSTKLKTYSQFVQDLDISSGVVTIDLSVAQSFTLTVDEQLVV